MQIQHHTPEVWGLFDEVANRFTRGKIPSDLLKNCLRSLVEWDAFAGEPNPYQRQPIQLITRLQRANRELKLGIGPEIFLQLARTIPGLPAGPNYFLSLEVRFGHDSKGVIETFKKHQSWMALIFGRTFQTQDYLEPTEEKIRLYAGDHTHRPGVRWICVNLASDRTRTAITHVRSSDSLADQLLTFACLYPERINDIDFDRLPGLFAAGYEIDGGIGQWSHSLYLHRSPGRTHRVQIGAGPNNNSSDRFAVPKLHNSVLN